MAEKKRLGALGWVLIGCGGILLIGGIIAVAGVVFVGKKAVDYAEEFQENPAAMAAETVVRLNPDLELIESDREAGKITVLQKSTGEETTFDYEEIQEGRFSFENADGETVSFDAKEAIEGEGGQLKVTTSEGTQTFGASGDAVQLPGWIPRFPGGMNDLGGMSQEGGGRRSGSVGFATDASPQEVSNFYTGVMEDLDMSVETSAMSSGAGQILHVAGRSDDRNLTVSITSPNGQTRASIVYEGPA
jgi:hypothetical protein